jgi:hypothetical protein
MSRWLGSQCGHIGLHTAQAASASSRFLAQMLDHCTSVVHATGEYSRGGFGERPNAHAAQFGSYCFQFAAKLGVLLVSISFFHREGCLFYEAGGGRGPVGVAVRAQRGSLRRGLCNSPPTFLEDRQDYLQHLGGAGARSGILRGPSLSRLTTAGPGSRRPQRGPLRGDEVPQLLRSDVATVFRSVRGP